MKSKEEKTGIWNENECKPTVNETDETINTQNKEKTENQVKPSSSGNNTVKPSNTKQNQPSNTQNRLSTKTTSTYVPPVTSVYVAPNSGSNNGSSYDTDGNGKVNCDDFSKPVYDVNILKKHPGLDGDDDGIGCEMYL